jgi:phenylacetate-coenzyme A ligase PaaK-like adenylate-forming protein
MENLQAIHVFLNRARETMQWEKRREHLDRRFTTALTHAYGKSKAYRERFDAAGMDVSNIRGLDDLEIVPILRMAELVKCQEADPPFGGFNTVHPEALQRIYVNPGFILQPGERQFEDTSWAEALCGAGFTAGDRLINTFNYHLWPFAFMMDESVRMINGTVVPTGVGNTMMQVRIMQKLRVNGYVGTPSFLMNIIQRAEEMGVDFHRDMVLKKAIVGAEMLPESMRRRLEEKLKMTIRDAYGTVLSGCIGYECAHMTGLHVPDNMVVEVVDPQTGKSVKEGAAGEVVVTNFNRVFPMIRLATGDLSMMTQKACPCGRTGPMLKKIMGRTDQATKVRGTFIHPWQADEIIKRYPEVFKYQVLITRKELKDVMTFVVELKEETTETGVICGRMERDIKDKLTVRGGVRVVPRGTIPDFHKKIDDRRTWQ